MVFVIERYVYKHSRWRVKIRHFRRPKKLQSKVNMRFDAVGSQDYQDLHAKSYEYWFWFLQVVEDYLVDTFFETRCTFEVIKYSKLTTFSVFRVGPRCRPLATSAPGHRFWQTITFSVNPNTVFETTYLCTATTKSATTKSLFAMAPEWSIRRSTETESLIDSSTLLYSSVVYERWTVTSNLFTVHSTTQCH